MSVDGLRVDRDAAVVHVQIDAGPGNLFTPAMTAELTSLLRSPPDGVHVLHLSAAGDEFCMGRAPFREGAEALREDVDGLVELVEALQQTSIVTVVEAQGDAAGFGVGLVALSDVAVATTEVRLSFPEVDAGFAPALVLAWLGELVGRRTAFWLAATGDGIAARDAREAGLLTHVVEPAELAATISSTLELLLSKPPAVHAEIKRLVRLYAGVPADLRGAVAGATLSAGALVRRHHR